MALCGDVAFEKNVKQTIETSQVPQCLNVLGPALLVLDVALLQHT